jgi:hypothetical protein
MNKITMHKIRKADIVVSVGRGLIIAAAIVGATYYLGSWYLGGNDLETIYQSMDNGFTPRVEHATAPAAVEEATQ